MIENNKNKQLKICSIKNNIKALDVFLEVQKYLKMSLI